MFPDRALLSNGTEKTLQIHSVLRPLHRISLHLPLTAVLTTLVLCAPAELQAQLKRPKQRTTPTLTIKPSDVDYQLWENFQLVRKANDGDPLAQHELGLRYLTGRGFFADTAKAVEWLQRAAGQDLPLAHYNLGILASNGWGMAWNPFTAFRHFRSAAERDMPDALYAVGIFHMENLVVPADWKMTAMYLQKGASGGSEAAKAALAEFGRKGLLDNRDSLRAAASDTLRPLVPPLMLQDFETDTLTISSRPEQLDSLVQRNSLLLRHLVGIDDESADTTRPPLEMLASAAAYGSPEARVLLGKCYQMGMGVPKDILRAAEEYLNALRLDAPRAYDALWELIVQPEFRNELEASDQKDAVRAKYISAGLAGFRINLQLSDQQAVQLLREATEQKHIPSMIELGIRHASGRGVERDRERAKELWREAARLGSREAEVRLAMARVVEEGGGARLQEDLRFLVGAADSGSVLAQLALGFCHERGIGCPVNKGEAAGMYRRAARRGNQAAYLSLRQLHDELRPPDKEFIMGD